MASTVLVCDPVEWPAGGDEYLMTALAGRGDEELEELQHDSVVRVQLGVRYRVGDPVGTAGAQAGLPSPRNVLGPEPSTRFSLDNPVFILSPTLSELFRPPRAV